MTTIAWNVYSFDGYVHPPGQVRGDPAGRDPLLWTAEAAAALRPYSPDIVTTSESRSEACVAALARALSFDHVVFPSRGKWPGGLLTRCRIVESGNLAGLDPPEDLFTRHWGRALLETSRGARLAVHSLHTIAADPVLRPREIAVVLGAVHADLDAGLPVLVQGDFNHRPDAPEAAQWASAGLVDAFAAAPGAEDEGHTLLRPHPAARIDYVMASGSLASRIRSCRPLNEGPFRLDPARPDAVSLSDHLPVLAAFDEET